MSGNPGGSCSPPPSEDHPAFTDKPTVLELKKMLSELRDWKRFGARLPGITSRMIDTLGRYGDQSIGSRKDALFTKWLRVYEKASWNDIITALFISGEFKLLSSVAIGIDEKSYTREHGPHTTSESSQATNDIEQTTMTDDVPNDDELKRDARRAITRNIDELTDVISSSESNLQDVVLGCAAKEVIPPNFKNRLLNVYTTMDAQTRAAELVRHIETFVRIDLTYLDVFLTILATKCLEAGRIVARNVAKEYGHELPQYEARKLVIGAEGGAVSNDITTITLISEDQVIEDIKSLYQAFGSVVIDVRLSLSNNDVRRIAIYIEAIIKLCSLTEVKTIDELFDKIQPHYSFLDCELLEAIVNKFLSTKGEIQAELSQYVIKVKEFKKSSRLRHIKTAIEEALIPKQDVTDTTCRVVIKLHEIWGSITLKRFNDVLEYLFSTRKNILAHIHIEGGSISISFIAPLSQSQYLINNVMSKKIFLQRIGIIDVSINDRSILSARVNGISINQSLIDASEEGDVLGVSILLELGASVDYMNGDRKTSLMLACSGGHEHVVQTLLSANAGVNSQDRKGYTALMEAVESQSIKIATSLLKHNADPNKVTLDGNTALILACAGCQTDIVKLLLLCNADPSFNDFKALQVSTRTDNHRNILLQLIPIIPYSSWNALAFILAAFAVKYGQPEIIATLLRLVDPKITKKQIYISISCCNEDHKPTLMLLYDPDVDLKYHLLPPINIASSCGHLPIVELLLRQDISVDIKSLVGYTPLMYASGNGHLRVVELLLKRKANVNIQNNVGYTALMLASENGHHQVVKLLLNEHADVDVCDKNSSTALILASNNGHHQAVELILNKHADVNIHNNNGSTALMLASDNGHHQVVKLLLNEHADINVCNNNSSTALILASNNGHHQVVELLLNKHADVNICSNTGSTALILASQNGHYQVVELLLNKHADVTIHEDNAGSTALIQASQNGHHQVVELLLNKHADVNICDNYGWTSLVFASQNGHHQVVELLLNKHANVNVCNSNALILSSCYGHHQVVELLLNEHVNVNACDNNGSTALMLASQNGHHQVVELLLSKHADVNIRAYNGSTALILASQGGYYQVVELLLKKNADANICNNYGYSALMLASQNDHHQVVELLLNKHADVNIRTNNSFTALMLASGDGHHQVVELLLNKHADVNIRNDYGSTALIKASQDGHHQVVKLLLDRHADVNIHDNKGCTALIIASQNGHHQVVELLLNKHADDVNSHDNAGCTALIIASQNGHHQVVELLLDRNADVNIHSNYANTALILASHDGHYQVVKLLLNNHADVNVWNNDGCTALIIASQNGHHQVVELLLNKHADVSICANNGYSALMLASQNGHHQVVELLLNKHADVNIHNDNGYTALFFACTHNHQEVVKLLLKERVDTNDKWLCLMLAKYRGHNELVELLLDEVDIPQTDSSSSTEFKPVHNEIIIIESEDQEDHTIKPVTQSSLDPFKFSQKEKEVLMKNLTSKIELKLPHISVPSASVEFLMRHQPRGKLSPIISPTTLSSELGRVI